MAELYRRYSHFKFSSEQWMEAAERYLELETELRKLEEQDGQVNHDDIYEAFGRCEVCERINPLTKERDAFAIRFATIWAKKANELKKEN